NDDKKVITAAEIAWTNGWKTWDGDVIGRINDCRRNNSDIGGQLPPPPKSSTPVAKALFPLNVLPDMLVEGVCECGDVMVSGLRWCHDEPVVGTFRYVMGIPLGFVGGLVNGVQEAWRGYPFWDTYSIRAMQGREYPLFTR
ncbi:MAG: hypothetical protein IKS67_00545, partial [Victivallales bacterium]|nr:hypothetical protein [Victivallales bacterium]